VVLGYFGSVLVMIPSAWISTPNHTGIIGRHASAFATDSFYTFSFLLMLCSRLGLATQSTIMVFRIHKFGIFFSHPFLLFLPAHTTTNKNGCCCRCQYHPCCCIETPWSYPKCATAPELGLWLGLRFLFGLGQSLRSSGARRCKSTGTLGLVGTKGCDR